VSEANTKSDWLSGHPDDLELKTLKIEEKIQNIKESLKLKNSVLDPTPENLKLKISKLNHH